MIKKGVRGSPTEHRERVLPGEALFLGGKWENPTRAIPPRTPPQPNRPKPSRTIKRLSSAPCPQALRSARDAWRPRGLLSEETAHTPRKAHKQGAERSHMHGGMHGDSLFAAAGSAPERPSLLAHRRSPKLISEIKKKKPKPTTNKTPNPELGPS